MRENPFFPLEGYVKAVATGEVGRVEIWTQKTNQYFVEFNRDSATRQWFAESALEPVEPPKDAQ